MRLFFPAGTAVPLGARSDRCLLEPLTPAHVALDYAALMASQAQLRLWSGSAWPQDSFTLDDNLADLTWHDEEHRERIAFTYTVLDLERTRCLGCVYLKPLGAYLPANEVGNWETAVRFWAATPTLADRFDAHLLDLLCRWFRADWPLRRVLFHTRSANARQLTLFAATGLSYAFTQDLPKRGGTHQFWELLLHAGRDAQRRTSAD